MHEISDSPAIVILKWHLALFPAKSVAMKVMRVSPMGRTAGDSITGITDRDGRYLELSKAMAGLQDASATLAPSCAITLMFSGQVMIGGVTSV